MKPGPKPNQELRRNYRATVSLSNDVAYFLGVEHDKSRVVENALRLWYGLGDYQRESMLTAILFKCRIGVQ